MGADAQDRVHDVAARRYARLCAGAGSMTCWSPANLTDVGFLSMLRDLMSIKTLRLCLLWEHIRRTVILFGWQPVVFNTVPGEPPGLVFKDSSVTFHSHTTVSRQVSISSLKFRYGLFPCQSWKCQGPGSGWCSWQAKGYLTDQLLELASIIRGLSIPDSDLRYHLWGAVIHEKIDVPSN